MPSGTFDLSQTWCLLTWTGVGGRGGVKAVFYILALTLPIYLGVLLS